MSRQCICICTDRHTHMTRLGVRSSISAMSNRLKVSYTTYDIEQSAGMVYREYSEDVLISRLFHTLHLLPPPPLLRLLSMYLTVLFWVKHCFTIKIDAAKNVSTLKESIKEEKKPAFDDVVADALTLWRVSMPYLQWHQCSCRASSSWWSPNLSEEVIRNLSQPWGGREYWCYYKASHW